MWKSEIFDISVVKDVGTFVAFQLSVKSTLSVCVSAALNQHCWFTYTKHWIIKIKMESNKSICHCVMVAATIATVVDSIQSHKSPNVILPHCNWFRMEFKWNIWNLLFIISCSLFKLNWIRCFFQMISKTSFYFDEILKNRRFCCFQLIFFIVHIQITDSQVQVHTYVIWNYFMPLAI